MTKKKYYIGLLVVISICFCLCVYNFKLARTLSSYPTADMIYEKEEADGVYRIIRYELPNDFVLACTYRNDDMIGMTVHNKATNTTGTAHSKDSVAETVER